MDSLLPPSANEGPVNRAVDRLGDWAGIAFALFAVAWGANQFAPLLLVYRDEAGLDAATLSATFGVYAVGIVPAILLGGPLSDRFGRRTLVLPAALLSLVATLLLIGAVVWMVPLLYAGRFLAGLVSGTAFSAGSTWLIQRSANAAPGIGSIRNTIALSAGFGLGPLGAGLLAETGVNTMVTPYLPHLVLMAVGIMLLPREAERTPVAPAPLDLWNVLRPQLPWRAALAAPLPFGIASTCFVVLPQQVGDLGPGGAGALTAVCLVTGAAVQPVLRPFAVRSPRALGGLGVLLTAATAALMAVVVSVPSLPLLFATAAVTGVAYGLTFLFLFLSLGPAGAKGVVVSQLYVAAYLGFAAPYLTAGLAATVPLPALFLTVAAGVLVLAAVVSLAPVSRS